MTSYGAVGSDYIALGERAIGVDAELVMGSFCGEKDSFCAAEIFVGIGSEIVAVARESGVEATG